MAENESDKLVKEYVDNLFNTLESDEKLFIRDEIRKINDRSPNSSSDIIKLLLFFIKSSSKMNIKSFRLSPLRNYAEFSSENSSGQKIFHEIPKLIYINLITLIMKLSGITERIVKPAESEFYISTSGNDYDILVNYFPTILGPSVLIKLKPHNDNITKLDELGFSESDLSRIIEILKLNSGLMVVTGPKSSGKSTFIYSILNHISKKGFCIATAEEPVKKIINGIYQSQLNNETGYDKLSAMKGMLKHSADVIYISDVNDIKSMYELMKLSLSGKKCFATTNSRNIMMEIEKLRKGRIPNAIIAESLSMIVSLRLIRKNCSNCLIEYTPNKDLLDIYDMTSDSLNFRKGKGCSECNNSGFSGITFLYEIMPIDGKLKKNIASGVSGEELIRVAEDSGFCTFFDTAQYLFFEGAITLEEFHEAINQR